MKPLYIQIWIVKPVEGGTLNRIFWCDMNQLDKLPEGWTIKEDYPNTIMVKTKEGQLRQYNPEEPDDG